MNMRIAPIETMPDLGAGLGYRREIGAAIRENAHRIDFLEIVAEQFMSSAGQLDELAELADLMPVIPHAIGLSIGSLTPIDRAYLQKLREVSDISRAPYVSEHLCMTHVPGIEIGHLSPLWMTEEVLQATADKVSAVQETLGKPLILENITYPFQVPQGDMSQPEFFRRLVETTGCGILLDLTNVHTNAQNLGVDPIRFLTEMPLDRVIQVHLAGGFEADGVLIDSHSEPVEQASWDLLQELVNRITLRGCLIEHDSNFADPEMLIAEVERARRVMHTGVRMAAQAVTA